MALRHTSLHEHYNESIAKMAANDIAKEHTVRNLCKEMGMSETYGAWCSLYKGNLDNCTIKTNQFFLLNELGEQFC